MQMRHQIDGPVNKMCPLETGTLNHCLLTGSFLSKDPPSLKFFADVDKFPNFGWNQLVHNNALSEYCESITVSMLKLNNSILVGPGLG